MASSHFVTFFLGLEILSVSLYGMIAYLRTREQPLEAGVKYLILAAAASAFLLFGMALIYADLGTMVFSRIAQVSQFSSDRLLTLAGTTLILTGIGFKLAVVPFHLWTPDVYQGAPAPVTAFIATASKTAMFALLLRYFYGAGFGGELMLVLTIIAIASMFAGNLLALRQTHVKRILAYSSIAHFGYLLVAFLAGGQLAIEAVSFYLPPIRLRCWAPLQWSLFVECRERRGRSGGLSWTVLALSGGGRGVHGDAAVARWDSGHGRIHREIFCDRGGRAIGAMAAGDHPGCHQCHRIVLLPAHSGDGLFNGAGTGHRVSQDSGDERIDSHRARVAADVAGNLSGGIARPDPQHSALRFT